MLVGVRELETSAYHTCSVVIDVFGSDGRARRLAICAYFLFSAALLVTRQLASSFCDVRKAQIRKAARTTIRLTIGRAVSRHQSGRVNIHVVG